MSIKQQKEDFVSGLTGGSLPEIYKVTSVALAGYLLWAWAHSAGLKRNTILDPPTEMLIDLFMNWMVLLLSITLYASSTRVLYLAFIPLIVIIYFSIVDEPPASIKEEEKQPASSKKSKGKKSSVNSKKAEVSSRKPFLTAYRSGMMIITCAAILAVDFRVFPRRFAKVETWGTSLMDLGVGSFVLSMGIVSARNSRWYPGSKVSFTGQLRKSIRSSTALLLLGLIRVICVKLLDYQEHVTEYGVHWNFFITLGILPPVVTILTRFFSPGIMSVLVIAGYEIALNNEDLRGFILTAERTDLFSANREGMFSFFGYLSLFLFGQSIGLQILSPGSTYKRILTRLGIMAVLLVAISYYLTTNYWFSVSRRLANLPYCVMVATYNAVFLIGYAFIDWWFFQRTNIMAETNYKAVVPYSLEAVNSNSLLIFLAANILTGLVNTSVNTLNVSDIVATLILTAYMGALVALAILLDKYNIRFKI